MLCFSDCSSVIRGAPRLVAVAPRLVAVAPTCSQTYHNHSHGTPVPVTRDPSYSEGWPECLPRVWYSPEIDASKFILHILSDSPGGCQWLKYILLMSFSRIQIGCHARCGWMLIMGCLPSSFNMSPNHDPASYEILLEAVIGQIWRYTCRQQWWRLGDTPGSCDRAGLGTHCGAVIKRVGSSTWMPLLC